MSFGDEITQILAIIVVLLLAFVGLNFYSKQKKAREAARQEAAEKEGLTSPGGSAGGAIGLGDSTGGKTTSVTASRKAQTAERFQLTGKDAENAAKVIKRMFQGDKTD